MPSGRRAICLNVREEANIRDRSNRHLNIMFNASSCIVTPKHQESRDDEQFVVVTRDRSRRGGSC
jgi:hypothetical protein